MTVEMDAEPGDDVALTNMIDKQEHIQQTLMRSAKPASQQGRSGSGKPKSKGNSNKAKKSGGNKKGKS